MRVVSFCFDDGFRATADKARAIFDKHNITPCFCILAAPDLAQDPFVRGAKIADWSYWREAKAAGCEIAAHGYAHENLHQEPFANATEGLKRCFEVFAHELPGYLPAEAIFHVAYLTAPPRVVDWLRDWTLGVRTGLRNNGLSLPARIRENRLIDCISWGPETTDDLFAKRIERFLSSECGVLARLPLRRPDRPLRKRADQGMGANLAGR